MSDDEILSALRAILKQVAPDTDPATLAPEENFREAFEIDSFDHLRIMTAVSERFGVPVPEGEHGKLVSLKALKEFVERSR
ncbi:MAG: acyl carrier protein [Flavobacteriales bacterium]|nr:acyl carrier protein [Flavobacteriales bacterium]